MSARRLRADFLLALAVPLTAVAVTALKAGRWELHTDRYRIELKPRPHRSCPDCRGAGGWWVGGANPEMQACGCWAHRSELRIRLLPVPAWPDEPPF
ncbi:hypothetical protein [Streptomyces xanthochromogenes]|uniref:hypothetical protein n=1 Tax=Streptomyces xanthochromogenes TaxID=67384 RepID=UPI0034271F4A